MTPGGSSFEPDRGTKRSTGGNGATLPSRDAADGRDAGRRDRPVTPAAALAKAFASEAGAEARLRTVIDTIPTLAWWSDRDGSSECFNKRWHDYTGLTSDEAHGSRWKAAIHPDDADAFTVGWREVLASGGPGELEARLRRFDGEFRWFLFRIDTLRDENGAVVSWYGTETDIEDLRRAQSLCEAEKRTLEMIADGGKLDDILNELCRSIDAQAPDEISTILLVEPEGNRLWHAAGPLVPRAWLPAISPQPIGPREGCCGAAAYLKKRVIVADVATDPIWPDRYRGLAIENGIRAAWSEPILTKNGELLGTFAQYSPEPRVPTDSDLELIESAGQIALIAVGRQRSLEALRKSEAELRRITDAIPQCINVVAVDGRTLFANRVLLEYTGLEAGDISTPDFRERVFHPDDVARLRAERQRALSGEAPFELEQRLRRHDGTYRWFLFRFNPFRDENGRVVRWYATGTDIEDRKQAEERVRNENLVLRDEIDRSSMFEEIVGSSQGLRRVLVEVAKVARTDSTVLILGETGTGKELVARAIYKRSSRAGQAFIRVNCAAITPSLVAAELFGHEKGAFTGAVQRRVGRFEAADGGTIFLDEIGDLPIETQIALLRVLQEREFERIGSSRPVAVDVRVVAATNCDLKAAVAKGAFREDLFYRLNVFPLEIPPLRERKDDIALLVHYLIERYATKAGKNIRNIDKKTLEMFRAYDWPGNVRELQNVVERAVILCEGDTFIVDEWWLRRDTSHAPGPTVSLAGALVEREREFIETALAASQGRVSGPSGAAAKLGIPRQTLDSKIRALHIDKGQFTPS